MLTWFWLSNLIKLRHGLPDQNQNLSIIEPIELYQVAKPGSFDTNLVFIPKRLKLCGKK